VSKLGDAIDIGIALGKLGKARIKLSLKLHEDDTAKAPPFVDVYTVPIPRDERSKVLEKELMEDHYAGELAPENTVSDPLVKDVKAEKILHGFVNRIQGKRVQKAKVVIIGIPTGANADRYEEFRKEIPVIKGGKYPITIRLQPKSKCTQQQVP